MFSPFWVRTRAQQCSLSDIYRIFSASFKNGIIMQAAQSSIRVYNNDALSSLLAPETDDNSSLQQLSLQMESITENAVPEKTYESKTLSHSELRHANMDSLRTVHSVPSSPSRHMMSNKMEAEASLREDKYKMLQEQITKDSQRRKAEKQARRDAEFDQMYKAVIDGMDNPEGLLTEMDLMLAVDKDTKCKKKERLYKEWKEQVYDVIHNDLADKMNKMSIAEIERRRRTEFEAFLTESRVKSQNNIKATLFRDIIIESDYDPLSAHLATVRINTKGIKDPLKRDMVKSENEKREIGLELPDYGRCPGKNDTFSVQWYDKAESTPYGHFSNPDGTFKEAIMSEGAAKMTSSKINLDHYKVARGRAVMNAEMPLTKGIVEDHGHRKDRADFTNVVNHNAPVGVTGGDRWLEAKGKRPLTPPVDPNRQAGLYEVVNHTSDHREPGGHGDRWMSYKGKRTGINPMPPPGSRKDLFEVVHQQDGLVHPHRTPGDQWLEHRGRKWFPLHSDYEKKPPGETKIWKSLRDNDEHPYGLSEGPVKIV